MIAADETSWRGLSQVRILDLHDNPVAELRSRPHNNSTAAEQLQPGVERDLPKCHHDLDVRQRTDLELQVIETARDLLGKRLVVRRRAPDRRGDVRIREPQSIVRAGGRRNVRKTCSMECGHEEVTRAASAVAGEHATRAIGAVRRGGKAEQQKTRRRIAEAGDGAAPVRLFAVRAFLFARDSRAVVTQPGAAVA